MKPLHYTLYSFLLLLIVLGSCEKDDVSRPPTPPTGNKPPVANAGPDQVLYLPKNEAVLDGTASTDPDGSIAQYGWTKISGPASVNIANATSAKTTVGALVQGVYQFELVVTDNGNATSKDTIQVMVNPANGENQPPVAHAGADQFITLPTNSCTLNGSASYDPDGRITAYQWTLIAGPACRVQSPTSAQSVVSNLTEGVYRFELMVTDNSALTGKDTVQITVVLASACNTGNRPQVSVTPREIGTLSEARAPAVAAAGNYIVFAGGMTGTGSDIAASAMVDIFNTIDYSRTTTTLSKARWGMAAVSCGSKVFFAGGTDYRSAYDNVDIYDVERKTWEVAHLSEPRSNLAAAVVGDRVYFAGGSGDLWEGSRRVDIYDLSENKWYRATLPEGKFDLSAVALDSKIYFSGGINWGDGSGFSNNIQIFNTTDNTWENARMKELTWDISGVALGKTIYWGGIAYTNYGTSAKAEFLNTETGEATVSCLSYLRPLPTALTRDKEIIFFTGNSLDRMETINGQFIDMYNTLTGQWKIGKLKEAVTAPGVLSVNNTIYMGGGRTEYYTFSNKVYTLSW